MNDLILQSLFNMADEMNRFGITMFPERALKLWQERIDKYENCGGYIP